MDTLEAEHNDSQECNICYEVPGDIHELIPLSCCNLSKSICISCIHCLTTPICPYCRCLLPSDCTLYMREANNISRSEPSNTYTWEHFLEEENIINPYLYENSRRLRRQIRRLRYEYNQRRSQTQNMERTTRQERIRYRSTRRHSLRRYSQNMMHLYNQNRYNELFVMDDD